MIDAATLKLRYPAFANVDGDTIDYWLADAGRTVPAAWGDDQEPATLALAADKMVKARVTGLAQGEIAGLAANGVTSFRSGSFSAQFSETAVKRASDGGYGATPYGQEFLEIARGHVGTFGTSSLGPVVEGCGYRASLLGRY